MMISYQSAYDLVLGETSNLFSNWYKTHIEYVAIRESLGRFLANDLIADMNQPSFNASAMDGIAIRYTLDIQRWKIISEVKAGITQNVKLKEEECVLIMTGAEIPEDADTVIPVEQLDIINDYASLKPGAKVKNGSHIRYEGENINAGELSLPAFTRIQPTNISSITACGLKTIPVIQKPRLGIFSTGEELVEPDCKPRRGQVRATNLYALEALCIENGFHPVSYGIITDEKEQIKSALLKSVSENEIVCTTGGASVGKFDFIKQVLSELNAKVHFIQSNIKPGKPMIFGSITMNDRAIPIFCLPGNPVSTFVNFSIYMKPILRSVFFKSNTPFTISAILNGDLTKKDSKTHFILGRIFYDSAKVFFAPTGSSSSGDMQSLGNSSALGVFPEEKTILQKGELISCLIA